MRVLQLRTIAWLFALLSTGACAGTRDSGPLEQAITLASEEVYAGHLQTGVEQLEAALPDTLATPREELRVAYYLTQAHLFASLGKAFLSEPTSDSTRSLGTGARYRPSPTSHMVALVYHASSARALLDAHDGGLDRQKVEGNLRLATATTFARMGFHDVAGRVTERDPELLSLLEFEELLTRYDLPEELATWLAVLAFDAHKHRNEQSAYRFAILALEGLERFGLALTHASRCSFLSCLA